MRDGSPGEALDPLPTPGSPAMKSRVPLQREVPRTWEAGKDVGGCSGALGCLALQQELAGEHARATRIDLLSIYSVQPFQLLSCPSQQELWLQTARELSDSFSLLIGADVGTQCGGPQAVAGPPNQLTEPPLSHNCAFQA